MPKRNAIVVDMDGTLASVAWRLEHLQGPGRKDWRSFFAGMRRDAPVPWVVELTNADHGGAARIVVTGRPEDHREVCERWLATHGVDYDELLMRPAGDFRPDHLIKREIHDRELAPRFTITLVVDDRPGVVEMWRDLGYHVVVPEDPGLDPLD